MPTRPRQPRIAFVCAALLCLPPLASCASVGEPRDRDTRELALGCAAGTDAAGDAADPERCETDPD